MIYTGEKFITWCTHIKAGLLDVVRAAYIRNHAADRCDHVRKISVSTTVERLCEPILRVSVPGEELTEFSIKFSTFQANKHCVVLCNTTK